MGRASQFGLEYRPALTEKQFLGLILELAGLARWHVYHTWLSVRSAPGFPDLVLCRPPRLLFVECKSDRGVLTAQQRAWLALLRQCPGVEVYVWRPADWPEIERTLLYDRRPDDHESAGCT